jgi:hypothetical protein
MEESRGTTRSEDQQENALVSHALSDDDLLRLAKIRRNRRLGYMASFEEFDFLLEVIGRIE